MQGGDGGGLKGEVAQLEFRLVCVRDVEELGKRRHQNVAKESMDEFGECGFVDEVGLSFWFFH